MLSISAMSLGNEKYYLSLACEDYYLKGGEPLGRWWGKGAEILGLPKTVERETFSSLFRGFGKDGASLVKNAGSEDRKPGWDLTFSVPKSLSTFWSQADPLTRRRIQQVHQKAIEVALEYLQEQAGWTRRGKGGRFQELGGLVVGTFEHGTSRAGDPQLHTHCLFLNTVVRAGGKSGALHSPALYQHKMVAGAVYRAELSALLMRELGLVCERKRSWFEVRDVPHSLNREFSKRRQSIEAALDSMGLETASAAAFATLATRDAKTLVAPRAELFDRWRAVGREHGFSEEQTQDLLGRSREQDRTRAFAQSFTEGLQEFTARQSYFSEREILRAVLVASQGRGLDARSVIDGTRRSLAQDPRILALGQGQVQQRYTTHEMYATEKKLLSQAEALHGEKRHGIPSRIVEKTIKHFSEGRSPIVEELKYHIAGLARATQDKKTPRIDRETMRRNARITLNEEQAQAVRELTAQGSLKFLTGMAGSGKTSTIAACRVVWERAGYRVLGAALAGKAAEELHKGSGIRATTIAALELCMDPSFSWHCKHHVKQLLRAALGKPTFALKPLAIDKRTVLVIDEAGMVGTQQMARLMEAVRSGGGKLVLVGDPRQLQPIEAGGPFASLTQRLPTAKLETITRQRDERDRQAVRDIRQGEAEKALSNFAGRDRLRVEDTRAAALRRLVSDWANREAIKPAESLIFCGTNREAAEINRRCQAERAERASLNLSRSVDLQNGKAYVGDRVLLLKNSAKLGVNNGQTATIQTIDALERKVQLAVDGRKKPVVIKLGRYREADGERKGEVAMRLGYAVTTHKGQGSTVERAYVLCGDAMQDREISYVQASRARGETRLYTDWNEAGEELKGLGKQMERSRMKELAHDLELKRRTS
ncbi:MAG: relaxase domain-containing protein [Planctomycetes bacterium]|nr:relaxase domain-containing protein [Planctomycetota bacterium]MBI3833468.1 relaxase domain-containing protein [Planctomycetota bacterium]